MRTLGIGLALTAAVNSLFWLVWGPEAVVAGLAAGLLAVLIQVVATRRLQRHFRGSNAEFFGAMGTGMALRMAGVVLILLAIVVAPARFAPLPTAFGFLGVLIPLLFLEVRQVR